MLHKAGILIITCLIKMQEQDRKVTVGTLRRAQKKDDNLICAASLSFQARAERALLRS
tara:strand:- start:3 stop:176 length:174 start_codon:yes stop_codon:yes gene_type:complete